MTVRSLASGPGDEMSVTDLSPCSYPGSLRLSHSAAWIMRIMISILLETGFGLKIASSSFFFIMTGYEQSRSMSDVR